MPGFRPSALVFGQSPVGAIHRLAGVGKRNRGLILFMSFRMLHPSLTTLFNLRYSTYAQKKQKDKKTALLEAPQGITYDMQGACFLFELSSAGCCRHQAGWPNTTLGSWMNTSCEDDNDNAGDDDDDGDDETGMPAGGRARVPASPNWIQHAHAHAVCACTMPPSFDAESPPFRKI